MCNTTTPPKAASFTSQRAEMDPLGRSSAEWALPTATVDEVIPGTIQQPIKFASMNARLQQALLNVKASPLVAHAALTFPLLNLNTNDRTPQSVGPFCPTPLPTYLTVAPAAININDRRFINVSTKTTWDVSSASAHANETKLTNPGPIPSNIMSPIPLSKRPRWH
ncbi:MAG: hypothetical protein ACTS5R_01335 [Candidatus Hodgkinia cicadicola]